MQVVATDCRDYDRKLVLNTVRDALTSLQVEQLVARGDSVLLKPNLLSPHQPEAGITTHPIVVEAVITYFQELEVEVKVGESSGGMMVNQSLTEQAFQKTGVLAVCQKLGVEVINFDRASTKIVSNDRYDFPLPEVLLEADLVVSLPKLKTHSLTLFTGAIKNLYGCIPGMKKVGYHRSCPHPADFSELIVDIFELVKPDLAVMDGIVGLEGNGPGSTGDACQIGVLLASQDLVALDAVAASYLGYTQNQVPITRIAAKRDLGSNQLQQIEIIGGYQPAQQGYRLPSNALLSLLPNWLLQPLFGSLLSQPVINHQECIKCQRCVQSCPQDVIVDRQGLEIEEKGCIKCLCCQELCPQEAITVKEHLLVKLIRSIKGFLR
ncbi:DUF362 domain-containing protein [Natroniella acetigena]|uniref:DUF362 domain-containing protein n=1 Tax=Natroniella acetigena TaxID=52004 RepID=UPI00200A12EB|nr:DUF362 domain-containing protein [Natroniella acetigena]MCK8827012.1 DUF362 domain-containing protein [Natroniella acetigena]